MMIGFPINKYQIIKKSINVYALPYSALASTPRFFCAIQLRLLFDSS